MPLRQNVLPTAAVRMRTRNGSRRQIRTTSGTAMTAPSKIDQRSRGMIVNRKAIVS